MIIAESYELLESAIRTLYESGEYEKIIELVDLQKEHFPDQRLPLAYWQISMAARIAAPSLCYHFMDHLLVDGLWLSQRLLRESPFFELLQGQLDFEQRVEKFLLNQTREQSQLLPLLTLHTENGCLSPESPCPLLIGLHDVNYTSLRSIKFWQPIAKRGWLVGVPQSTQAVWSGAYTWDNLEITQTEIATHVDALTEKYAVDARRTVLAGHGRGGEMAAFLTVSGGVDVRGFVAVFPYGKLMGDLESWMRTLQGLDFPNLRGAFIFSSTHADMPKEEIEKLVEIFNLFDVACHLEWVEGDGQIYTPAIDQAIINSIDFVLS